MQSLLVTSDGILDLSPFPCEAQSMTKLEIGTSTAFGKTPTAINDFAPPPKKTFLYFNSE